MKLLFDENISHRIIPFLPKLFQDCSHSRLLSPSLKSDKEIWNYALKHKCLIVTFDADFFIGSYFGAFRPKLFGSDAEIFLLKS